jgi:alpha-N-arabinofuranosidase
MDGGWTVAPHLIEEVYNLEDALVVAGFLNSFIRHADVVKVANIAQIVNIIAPILTRGDETLLQSSFYTFEMFSNRRRGVSLRPIVKGPTYVGETHGEASLVDASAIIDGDQLHVFATNRHTEKETEVRIVLEGRSITGIVSGNILTGPGAKVTNTFEEPHQVISSPFNEAEIDTKIIGGGAYLELPPLSVAAVTFQL